MIKYARIAKAHAFWVPQDRASQRLPHRQQANTIFGGRRGSFLAIHLEQVDPYLTHYFLAPCP